MGLFLEVVALVGRKEVAKVDWEVMMMVIWVGGKGSDGKVL